MVVVLYYEKQAKDPAVYRRILNDLPADPFEVTGPKRIEALVHQYSQRGKQSIRGDNKFQVTNN